MKVSGNTILITGGSTGIGFALAELFLKQNNEVIICGRRKDKLEEAQEKLPKVKIKACDITNAEERNELFKWVTTNSSKLNILINNAGVQREIYLKEGTTNFLTGDNEIETNLYAPIYLSALFIPHLRKQEEAAIVNVSSGLAFIPLSIMPIYCATKAALHSFSLSLRHQLQDTTIKVFEVIPPMVDTELDKGTREKRQQQDKGIQPTEVADATIEALRKDEFEVAVGKAQFLLNAARNEPERVFQMMNSH